MRTIYPTPSSTYTEYTKPTNAEILCNVERMIYTLGCTQAANNLIDQSRYLKIIVRDAGAQVHKFNELFNTLYTVAACKSWTASWRMITLLALVVATEGNTTEGAPLTRLISKLEYTLTSMAGDCSSQSYSLRRLKATLLLNAYAHRANV